MSLSHEELKLLRNLQHKLNDAATQIDNVLRAHIATDPAQPSPESIKAREDVKAALEKKRIALIGTPAHRVAQYFAKTLGKGNDNVQLDWTQDLERSVQLHDKEKLCAWIYWSLNDSFWKGRIKTAKNFVANIAEIAVQCERASHPTVELTVNEVPSTETFKMADQLCSPVKPTHEDQCRVQLLVEQYTEKTVRDVLNYALKDAFWFPKLNTRLFTDKFDTLKQQMLRSTLPIPTKAVDLPGRKAENIDHIQVDTI